MTFILKMNSFSLFYLIESQGSIDANNQTGEWRSEPVASLLTFFFVLKNKVLFCGCCDFFLIIEQHTAMKIALGKLLNKEVLQFLSRFEFFENVLRRNIGVMFEICIGIDKISVEENNTNFIIIIQAIEQKINFDKSITNSIKCILIFTKMISSWSRSLVIYLLGYNI